MPHGSNVHGTRAPSLSAIAECDALEVFFLAYCRSRGEYANDHHTARCCIGGSFAAGFAKMEGRELYRPLVRNTRRL